MSDDLICCLCECPEKFHLNFWNCPIFEGEKICQECCQLETLKTTVNEKFSEKLGRSISLEDVNKACQKCGLNCAKQNDLLFSKLENGAFNDLSEPPKK